MTDEMQVLRLAAIIENGGRANADGYTKQVGYTSTIGGTKTQSKGYSAPIGNMDTKSDEEVALETASMIDSEEPTIKKKEVEKPVKNFTPEPDSEAQADEEEQEVKDEPTSTKKKTLLDRIKEKPVVFAIIGVVLAVLTFGLFKSEK